MTDSVNLIIESCGKCPHLKVDRHYTADSFEMVFDWKCGLAAAHISMQDWNDKAPPIPKWCPLRKKV